MDTIFVQAPEELRWAAVLGRVPGDFLYAVTTMGVFLILRT